MFCTLKSHLKTGLNYTFEHAEFPISVNYSQPLQLLCIPLHSLEPLIFPHLFQYLQMQYSRLIQCIFFLRFDLQIHMLQWPRQMATRYRP